MTELVKPLTEEEELKNTFGDHMSFRFEIMDFGKIPNNPNIQQVNRKNND